MAISTRAVVMALAVFSIIAWGVIWYTGGIRTRGWAVSALSWHVNVLMFSAAAWLHLISPVNLNIWSNIVRAHGLIALLSIAGDIITEQRRV